MKNTLLTRNTILAILIGAISTILLRPVLLTPVLLITVFIPIPYIDYAVVLFVFLCGGAITGFIAKRSGWLFGGIAGLVASVTIILSYWSQIRYSFSLHELSHYFANAPIALRFDLGLIPFEISISALGGYIVQKLQNKR